MRTRHNSDGVINHDSDSDSDSMRCLSCKEEYNTRDAGTCKECYEEASENEEELKREIEDLKAKVAFLRFWSPLDHSYGRFTCPSFTDVVLIAADDGPDGTPVPAHKALLVCSLFSSICLICLTSLAWSSMLNIRVFDDYTIKQMSTKPSGCLCYDIMIYSITICS